MKKLYFSVIAMIIAVTSFGQAGTISGPSAICSGVVATMIDTVSGGTWSSSSTAIATVSTSGLVVGISAGVTTISYTVSGISATHVVTVYPVPTPISGPTTACVGVPVTYTSSTGGGLWSVSSTAVATINATSGVLDGITSGTDVVSYTLGASCSATYSITVGSATAGPITGTLSTCIGSTSSLTDATSPGAWLSANPAIASVSYGVVTGNSAGTTTISYVTGGSCGSDTVTASFTVSPTPAIICPSTLCVGGTATLSDSVPGGSWTYTPLFGVISGTTGVITGVAPGTVTISYASTSGCVATHVVTVTASTLSVTASVSYGVCDGGVDTLTASCSGAVSYSWSPATGLSCATCASTYVTTADTGAYTIVATDAMGCTGTATLAVDANRIKGHVYFGGVAPGTTSLKVWLIQFNPMDSTLVAQDSMLTCLDGGVTPYYQFNDKASGDYMVKAKLLSSVPGTSDYIPTYGYSNAHWDSSTTITHAGGANTQDINMIYGMVPSGPGFIGGTIVSGAGKRTSGDIPAVGMLVYLEDGAGTILTYTYTDASGMFAFSSLGLGSYIVYPTDFKYYTTPSAVVTLTGTSDSSSAVDFKQHTTLGTITPYTIPTSVPTVSGKSVFGISPNPTTGNVVIGYANLQPGTLSVTVADVLGHNVYTMTNAITAANGSISVDLSKLSTGVYTVHMTAGANSVVDRIVIEK